MTEKQRKFKGYHGTSHEASKKILEKQEFKVSVSNEEWLGKGIYFYPDLLDAFNWAKKRYCSQPAVLCADVIVSDNAWLDLDSEAGKQLYEVIVKK